MPDIEAARGRGLRPRPVSTSASPSCSPASTSRWSATSTPTPARSRRRCSPSLSATARDLLGLIPHPPHAPHPTGAPRGPARLVQENTHGYPALPPRQDRLPAVAGLHRRLAGRPDRLRRARRRDPQARGRHLLDPGHPVADRHRTCRSSSSPETHDAEDQASVSVVVAAPKGHTLREAKYAGQVDELIARPRGAAADARDQAGQPGAGLRRAVPARGLRGREGGHRDRPPPRRTPRPCCR